MKALFIIPPYGFFRNEGEEVTQKKGFLPPLGPALLATILENEGHDVRILDLQVDIFTEKDLLNYVGDYNPNVVCLSLLAATTPIVNHIFTLFDKNFPEIITICGGIHASIYPQQTLENTAIDYVIYGEAEYSLKELIVALDKKKDIHSVKGVYYMKDGIMEFTGHRPTINNLDEFPIPSRKYFDLKKYVPLPNQYK